MILMDNKTIKKLYTEKNWTLRMIAEKFNTNHHLIKRRLVGMGIKITRRNTLKKFSDEHRQKISDSRKRLKASGWIPYNKGLKTADRPNSKEMLAKNMLTHIRFDVSLDWLLQFDDFEKLKFLNRAITPRDTRYKVDTSWYEDYVVKFYTDKQFNDIYSKWLSGGKNDKYLMPTIDHINPKANGGQDNLDNLQFLTWFENRAKNDMPLVEWRRLKENMRDYLYDK
jgi:5-methylcytosine-specific restriction endonuclease McrA